MFPRLSAFLIPCLDGLTWKLAEAILPCAPWVGRWAPSSGVLTDGVRFGHIPARCTGCGHGLQRLAFWFTP